jgi:hypothetical protein
VKFIGPVLAAAVASLALPAAASPAFDAFRQVCGDSHGDFAAIRTALAAPGWAPADVLPNSMEGVTPTEGVARVRKVGDQQITIYAWIGMKGAFHLTACTAKVSKIDLGAATQDAQTWVGFAPESAAGGKSTWRYGETGGARAAVQQAGFQAAADGGGLFFFNVFADHGEAVLDLLKIKS